MGANASADDLLSIKLLNLTKKQVVGPTPAKPLANSQLAKKSLDVLDKGIDRVNAQMSEVGASYNRLESTIANLEHSVHNTASSESRIVDADFANETAELAKDQLIHKAGMAALSQRKIQRQALAHLL